MFWLFKFVVFHLVHLAPSTSRYWLPSHMAAACWTCRARQTARWNTQSFDTRERHILCRRCQRAALWTALRATSLQRFSVPTFSRVQSSGVTPAGCTWHISSLWTRSSGRHRFTSRTAKVSVVVHSAFCSGTKRSKKRTHCDCVWMCVRLRSASGSADANTMPNRSNELNSGVQPEHGCCQ